MTDHATHDGFHAVTSDDPAWIETVWFPFWVPAADLSVYIRAVFQPNQGQYSASVAVWSGEDRLRFEAPLAGSFARLEDLGDLRDLSLPGDLQLQCLATAERYRLRYAHRDCEIDVTFDALTEPVYPPVEDSPGMFAGHLDQHGHVTGTLRLGEETWSVCCGSIRDRSWGPRVVRRDLRLGNAHGTTEVESFFAYLLLDEDGTMRITGGMLHRAGVSAPLVDGTRTTEWDGQWPVRVQIEATDADGRELAASGTCRNRRAVVANPDLYAVLNLVEWSTRDGMLWGENHDVWSRSAWVAAGRAPLESD